MNKLEDYEKKRDFEKTPEPTGVSIDSWPHGPMPDGVTGRFVIQEHHASRLHWDLRLEEDGVLKSWAVPKGVPEEKDVKRLAVEVEDHPLDYIDFTGIIPEGLYGAGTVEIWDRGYYTLLEKSEKKYYVAMLGQRIRGTYFLVRTKDNQWLLWKKLDAA